jgi:hypothetical protein
LALQEIYEYSKVDEKCLRIKYKILFYFNEFLKFLEICSPAQNAAQVGSVQALGRAQPTMDLRQADLVLLHAVQQREAGRHLLDGK